MGTNEEKYRKECRILKAPFRFSEIKCSLQTMRALSLLILAYVPWWFALCFVWDVLRSSPVSFAYAVRIASMTLRTARFLCVICAEICVKATFAHMLVLPFPAQTSTSVRSRMRPADHLKTVKTRRAHSRVGALRDTPERTGPAKVGAAWEYLKGHPLRGRK